MNKEEYYNRLNKITSKITSDRVSKDEEYNLICQKNYLATKYIESLEQENKELHNKIDKVRELVENSDWRLDDVHDLIDGYNEIEEILNDGDVDE